MSWPFRLRALAFRIAARCKRATRAPSKCAPTRDASSVRIETSLCLTCSISVLLACDVDDDDDDGDKADRRPLIACHWAADFGARAGCATSFATKRRRPRLRAPTIKLSHSGGVAGQRRCRTAELGQRWPYLYLSSRAQTRCYKTQISPDSRNKLVRLVFIFILGRARARAQWQIILRRERRTANCRAHKSRIGRTRTMGAQQVCLLTNRNEQIEI